MDIESSKGVVPVHHIQPLSHICSGQDFSFSMKSTHPGVIDPFRHQGFREIRTFRVYGYEAILVPGIVLMGI
jgi:hypothetical protein